jgi:hypothetical protein
METRNVPTNFGHISLKFERIIDGEDFANREGIGAFSSENNSSWERYC